MRLDIATLTIVASMVFATQVIAVFIQYKVNKKYRGLDWWLLGSVLQALGFLAMPFLKVPSIWMLAILANPLVISGQLALNVGIAKFLDFKESGWAPASILIGYIAFYAYFILVDNSISHRAVLVSATTAVIAFLIGSKLFLGKKKNFSGSALLTASVFIAYGCFQVSETIVALLLPPMNAYKEINLVPIRVMSFIVPIIGSLLWTFGFIAMVNQRLNSDISEEREKLRTVFDISPDAKSISRLRDGLIVDVNEGFLEIMGLERVDTIGRAIYDIGIWANAEEMGGYLSAASDEGGVVDRECTFKRRNGDRFIGLVSGRKILMGEEEHAITVIYDITDRILAEQRIKKLLGEKELLLKEVHHRIKNNMSTISSLLSLQAGALKESASVAALEDARHRMQSMMVLYDKLYRSKDFSRLSVAEYLSPLVDEIVSNFPNASSVKVEKDFEDFVLEEPLLQPLGLIVNELVTNIMKYAFVGREGGVIEVSTSLKGDRAVLEIADDGNGMPASIGFDKSSGFGLSLVEILTRQIKGTIRIERGNGTRIVLEYPR